MTSAVSDISSTVEEEIAEGDKVVVRFTNRFKHTGELMGIPATDKEMELGGVGLYRIAGGKIVEI